MLDIGEVARRSGLPPSTLRFYEEKGLIASAGRHGLRRQYDPDVLDRLGLIALGRAGDFSLDEIAAMLPGEEALAIDRRVLLEKADHLDETIRRLTATRDGLRHAATCPTPRHVECPRFQALVRSAFAGVLRPGAARGRGGRRSGTVAR